MVCQTYPLGYILLILCTILLLSGTVGASLDVSYIDVGQGDAELLQSDGHFMLIDAGPSDAGGTVVAYLKGKGVRSLDYIIATHPHEDHIGGMMDVLNTFPVGTYVDSGATHTTRTYENIMSKLVTDQTGYAVGAAGTTFIFGDTTVDIIGPKYLTGDTNQDSESLKVTDGAISFLFPGDGEQVATDATIMKVAHHGSAGSTINLGSINPEVAVIDVGVGNTYGHPTQGTMRDLDKAGISVYRTDTNGDIEIISDGSGYTVDTSRGSAVMSISASKPGVTAISTPQPPLVRTVSPVYPTPVTAQKPGYAAPVFSSLVSGPSVSSGPCSCNGPDKNCADFSSGAEAQSCYEFCQGQGFGDCFGLDKDSDGNACESLK